MTGQLIVSILHGLISGICVGYNAVLFNVPENFIRNNAGKEYINDELWGIINGMLPVGALVGVFISGKLMNKFGRKWVILWWIDAINILGSLFVAASIHSSMILFGRFLMGITTGSCGVVCSAYLSEIAPTKWRGRIGCLLQLSITFTMMVSVAVSKLWMNDVYWRYGSLIPGIICLIQLLFCWTAKESPKWLQAHRNETETDIVLQPQSTNTNEGDIDETTKLDDRDEMDKDFTDDILHDISFHESLWNDKGVRQALIISMILNAVKQLCGNHAITYYSKIILENNGVKDQYLGTLYIFIGSFVSCAISIPIVDRFGRRPLLLLSMFGVGISCYILVYSYKVGNEVITLIFIILFVIFFQFGLGAIVWPYVAEITLIKHRDWIISISQIINYICNTAVAFLSPIMFDKLDAYTFLVFGIITSLGFIYSLLSIPETKMKTVNDIYKELNK